jgi:hypothetical protein
MIMNDEQAGISELTVTAFLKGLSQHSAIKAQRTRLVRCLPKRRGTKMCRGKEVSLNAFFTSTLDGNEQ